MLRTVDAILAQDHPGPVTTLVVFDKKTPDLDLQAALEQRGVEWIENTRSPGLAGARNTGTMALETDLIAFCDDDDVWHPDKLSAQMAALSQHPEAQLVTCGMTVVFQDSRSDRVAAGVWLDHAQFVRSRMAMVHSSTLLFRRGFLIDIGLVDEEAPSGQNEDWDLLLRASDRLPILNVERSLVDVLWGRTSFFTYAYQSKIDSLEWIMQNHPEVAADRKGHSRVLGQIAYWQACMDDDASARQTALQSLREDPTQWRAVMALGVSWHLLTGERGLRILHRFGRGV